MSEAPELKPCPFCGCKDVDAMNYCDGRIHCYRCGADGPKIPYAPDDKFTTWNTRATPAPPPEVLRQAHYVIAMAIAEGNLSPGLTDLAKDALAAMRPYVEMDDG